MKRSDDSFTADEIFSGFLKEHNITYHTVAKRHVSQLFTQNDYEMMSLLKGITSRPNISLQVIQHADENLQLIIHGLSEPQRKEIPVSNHTHKSHVALLNYGSVPNPEVYTEETTDDSARLTQSEWLSSRTTPAAYQAVFNILQDIANLPTTAHLQQKPREEKLSIAFITLEDYALTPKRETQLNRLFPEPETESTPFENTVPLPASEQVVAFYQQPGVERYKNTLLSEPLSEQDSQTLLNFLVSELPEFNVEIVNRETHSPRETRVVIRHIPNTYLMKFPMIERGFSLGSPLAPPSSGRFFGSNNNYNNRDDGDRKEGDTPTHAHKQKF